MKNKFLLLFLVFFTSANAQIGIGTTSPISKLHVVGDTAQPLPSGSTANAIFRISNSNNSSVMDLGQSKDNYSWIQSRSASNYSNSYPIVLNPNGGNVGINTTSPNEKLTVSGSITATGSIRSTASGQLLNCKFLNESDLGLSGSQGISTTTETTIASYTYTPVSNSSKIYIEFDTKASISGSTSDDFASHIYVGTTNIQSNRAQFFTGQGGGGRGNAIFPISGYYSNSGTSALTIYIKANRLNSDDTLTITHDNTLVIKEVAQ